MQQIEGGVAAAKGFMAAAAAGEIKYKGRTDLALVYSAVPCVCAGTFTTNVVKAACVQRDMQIVQSKEKVHAVVLNSGIANAMTGKEGEEIDLAFAKAMADELGIKAEEVLTASTGVIGVQLPVEKLVKGAALLKKDLEAGKDAAKRAAKAIMTTDTVPKEYSVEVSISGKVVHIGGMAKGSGMIHPNMATMLSVITTDAVVERDALQEMLKEIVADTFNMISVDRDTSTNDTLLVLANGKAQNACILSYKKDTDYFLFYQALQTVCEELAKKMAADGEGANRLIETQVLHAKSKEDARKLAKSVITSNLVKTAVFGSDANWGRIFCAMGYSGAEFEPNQVDLSIEGEEKSLLLVKNGLATEYSEEIATELLSGPVVRIVADMKEGEEQARAWGCDLSYDYVKINGDYRS